MPTLDEIRACLSGDRFATETVGVHIDAAEPGYARCSMPVRPIHLNANSVPMGGAIFTLADFAFAVACNGFADRIAVSLQHDITYLAPAKGKTLIAEATRQKAGRSTCFCTVDVTDDLGTHVAYMTVNGFTTEPPVPVGKNEKKP